MKTWEKKRVGFIIEGAVARHNTPIYSGANKIGYITSGTKSPLYADGVAGDVLGLARSLLWVTSTEASRRRAPRSKYIVDC